MEKAMRCTAPQDARVLRRSTSMPLQLLAVSETLFVGHMASNNVPGSCRAIHVWQQKQYISLERNIIDVPTNEN